MPRLQQPRLLRPDRVTDTNGAAGNDFGIDAAIGVAETAHQRMRDIEVARSAFGIDIDGRATDDRLYDLQADVARKVVSIINLASVAAIEGVVGQPVHPLRFRANMYVSGWPAWHEFELLDRTLAIGDVRLKVVKRIVRCAAVNVDPESAARDLDIPHTLLRRFGHSDCGIYAEVIGGGSVRVGDAIGAEEPRLL